MNRPNRFAIAVAVLGGATHTTALLVFFERVEYVTADAPVWVGVFALLAFAQGALPLLASAHSRLVAPASGTLAAFAVLLAAELPAVGESTPLDAYVMSVFTGITLGLALFVGVLEFALRQGYGLGTERLRNLPPLPDSRSRRRVGIASAALVGVPAGILGFLFGGPVMALLVAGLATAAAAVPLLALIEGGYVTPLVPFALVVPYTLYGHAYYTTEVSGVGLLLAGPAAILSWLVWKGEATIRSRPAGWNGDGGGNDHDAWSDSG